MPRKSTAVAGTSSSTKAGGPPSSTTSNIVSQKSQANSSVTLFTLTPDSTQSLVAGTDDGALRRSPRKRVKLEPVEDMDMEDLGCGTTVPKVSPLLALRNKLVEAKTKGKRKVKAEAEAVETQAEVLLRKAKKEEGVDALLRLDDEDFKLPEEGSESEAEEEYTPDSSSRSMKSRSSAKRKASPRKPTRVVSKSTPAGSAKTTNSPPENWEEVYALIKEMRAKIVAPVDTMGCAQAQNKETDPKVRSIAVLFLTFVLLTLRNQW